MYPGAQSRTQRSIKSRIDPFFVIERIKDQNSLGGSSAFLGPTAARNNQDNNEADDRESQWGNSLRAKGHFGLHRPPAFADASASHGRPAGLACTLTRNVTVQYYGTRGGSCARILAHFRTSDHTCLHLPSRTPSDQESRDLSAPLSLSLHV